MVWRLLGLYACARSPPVFLYTTCNLRETAVFCRARSTGVRYSARPGASRAAARHDGPPPDFHQFIAGTLRYNTGQPQDGARPAADSRAG